MSLQKNLDDAVAVTSIAEIDGRGEEDAVFEVREKEVFAAGDTSDKVARVLGVGEIAPPIASR
jgi:hypothetical protein